VLDRNVTLLRYLLSYPLPDETQMPPPDPAALQELKITLTSLKEVFNEKYIPPPFLDAVISWKLVFEMLALVKIV
jgi:hypothetical protein